jgi:hypothetical protein
MALKPLTVLMLLGIKLGTTNESSIPRAMRCSHAQVFASNLWPISAALTPWRRGLYIIIVIKCSEDSFPLLVEKSRKLKKTEKLKIEKRKFEN